MPSFENDAERRAYRRSLWIVFPCLVVTVLALIYLWVGRLEPAMDAYDRASVAFRDTTVPVETLHARHAAAKADLRQAAYAVFGSLGFAVVIGIACVAISLAWTGEPVAKSRWITGLAVLLAAVPVIAAILTS